jgi:hypothetical protein
MVKIKKSKDMDGWNLKRYEDYKDPRYDKKRKIDDELTNEEFSKVDWTRFKIIVPTEKDKKELEEALHYLHNSDIDTDYVTVNQIVHTYLNEDEDYENNIIVDKELYYKLPEYKKSK